MGASISSVDRIDAEQTPFCWHLGRRVCKTIPRWHEVAMFKKRIVIILMFPSLLGSLASAQPAIPGHDFAVHIDRQEQRARLIPIEPRGWGQEAKALHNALRNALIEKASPVEVRTLLEAASTTYCSDKVDLLLICSWLQTPNIIRSLADIFEPDDWATLLDELSRTIMSTCKFAEFNDVNLRNAHVVQQLQNIGVIVVPSVLPASWTPKTVWGQTFWLLQSRPPL
jgi:hypothetical protein